MRAVLTTLATLMLVAATATGSVAATNTVTLTQSTGTVANSGSGQYLWYPDEHPAPVGGVSAALDSYARYPWRQLEPVPGQYDFSEIDRQLAAAQARGGTFGFRVMPVCGWCGLPDSLPADVSAAPTSWTATLADGSQLRVPDWNDPAYLTRWDALMSALGARYGSDPRLGYIDVGGYGNWGEGHNWPYESAYPRPQGQTHGTVASVTAVTTSVTSHFPAKTVAFNPVQLRDSTGTLRPDLSWQVLRSALTSSPRVGLRNDCLGGGSVQQTAVDLLTDSQARAVAEGVTLTNQPLERWRVAPFITEWCNNITPGSSDGTFSKGAQQVTGWHVSALSNANFVGSLNQYSATEQQAFTQANRSAGFRYGVTTVSTTTSTRRYDATVSATWANSGVAPSYRPWTVTYRVLDSTGAVRATRTSTITLSSLLGSGATRTDTVTLPTAGLPGGQYTLTATVTDPSGYLAPMTLASGTRRPDGSYAIATISLPRK